MCPESDFSTPHENFDSEWHVFEFWFDRSAKKASISNPSTGCRMELPRQDRDVDGFHLHEYCDFSPELSSYLRYLQIHHIILFSELPEVVHVPDTDESTASNDDWAEEQTFSYHTLLFRMTAGASALPYYGVSFLDDKLYSSVYLEIVESD